MVIFNQINAIKELFCVKFKLLIATFRLRLHRFQYWYSRCVL